MTELEFNHYICKNVLVQRKPLNVITGQCYHPLNVITCQRLYCLSLLSQISCYCYHSDNVITFGLAQIDRIKRLLLKLVFSIVSACFFLFLSDIVKIFRKKTVLIEEQMGWLSKACYLPSTVNENN